VTSSDLLDLEPAWSPDGHRIVFVRTGGEFPPEDIYVVNSDGSGLRQLTHTNQFQNGPSWSPDGKQIVFARGGSNTDYDLFVMNADGSQVEQLTRGPGNELSPAWSPDDSKIAYLGSPTANSGPTEIVVMSADRTGARRLPIGAGYPSEVAWSSDGQSLLYLQRQVDQGSDLYGIGGDGRDKRLILQCRAISGCSDINVAVGSPDGKLIALSIESSGTQRFHEDVYVLRADGTGLTKLTSGSLSSCCPSWQALAPAPTTPSTGSSSTASPARFVVTCSRLGATARPAPPGHLISKQEAIERACEEEGRGRTVTGIGAALGWYRAQPTSKQVRVWDITYHGTSLPLLGGPPGPQAICLVGDWEVAIDAHSGAFLVSGNGKEQHAVHCS